jgi:glycerol 3-phosphatase-2
VTDHARKSSMWKLSDRFDGFVIDLDGVVWVGRTPLPRAVDALRALRARGRRLLYVTNDPSSARVEYATRLRTLGVDVDDDEVITAGASTAAYLAEQSPGCTAYVIGSRALKDELRAVELRLLDGAAAIEQAELVVVGEHEDFNYAELRIAALAVRRGAALYATGRDATFPMPDGPWPATGAILAAVETASGQRARSLGKPEPFIFELARAQLADCAHVAVVGDNLEADIHGGQQAGLATILVLTGNASQADLARSPRTPDYVVDALASLI